MQQQLKYLDVFLRGNSYDRRLHEGQDGSYIFLSAVVKRAERESHHSLPTTAEVKNIWICTSPPDTPSWRTDELVKLKANFMLTDTVLQPNR
jgi:hypothetical protein